MIRYSYDGTDQNYDMSDVSGYQGTIYNWNNRNNYNISAIVDYDDSLNNTMQTLVTNAKKQNTKTYNDRKIVYSSVRKFIIGSASYTIKGKIYHVRVYNRALTEQEAIHNQYIDIYRYGIK